jgi:hypothetical protein
MATSSLAIKTHFRKLKDPRRLGRRQHRLLDILVIAICAVVAGSNSWTQIEAFGKRRLGWLKRFLVLENGIPSHDTFQRVFEALDPKALQACMRQWLLAVSGVLQLQQIAIDGKALRGSADTSSGLGPLHLVSAWATKQHLSLGQVAVEPGSNEITAVPKLLELLDLKGALVSLDAMGCQKEIARQIVERDVQRRDGRHIRVGACHLIHCKLGHEYYGHRPAELAKHGGHCGDDPEWRLSYDERRSVHVHGRASARSDWC